MAFQKRQHGEDGRRLRVRRQEPKHMNAGDLMHDGCLMTCADIALFQTAYRESGGLLGVTLSRDSTFIHGPMSASGSRRPAR